MVCGKGSVCSAQYYPLCLGLYRTGALKGKKMSKTQAKPIQGSSFLKKKIVVLHRRASDLAIYQLEVGIFG